MPLPEARQRVGAEARRLRPGRIDGGERLVVGSGGRLALEQRELLHQPGEGVGAATDQVPAWVGVGRRAPRPGVGRRRRQRRREAVVVPGLAVGDAVKEARGGLSPLDDEVDRLPRARARALVAGGEERQRLTEAAAPAGLPDRVRAVAGADREEALLGDEAGVDPRLVRRERRRERQRVRARGRAGERLAHREQPLGEIGDLRAVEGEEARAQRDRLAGLGRHRTLTPPGRPLGPALLSHEGGPSGDRGARSIVALDDREAGPSGRGGGIDQQDEAELGGRQEDRHGRGRQIGSRDLQPRSSRVKVEAWDVGDDRRDVGADVGRLGQKGRVADEARFEAIPRIAGAREHHVVVARPGVEIERQADASGRRAPGAEGGEEIDGVVAPRDGSRAQRERARREIAARRDRAAKHQLAEEVSRAARWSEAGRHRDLRLLQPIEGTRTRRLCWTPEPRAEHRSARRARPAQERPSLHPSPRLQPTLRPCVGKAARRLREGSMRGSSRRALPY